MTVAFFHFLIKNKVLSLILHFTSRQKNMSEERKTLKELKSNLKDALKKSGVLNTVKAQIRKEFISNMYNPQKGSLKPHANAKPLFERALYSAIYHCFKTRGFANSLSVFAAECGIENQSPLSELDIVQALQFGTRSSLYNAVAAKCSKSATTSTENAHSVLEMMIREGISKATMGATSSTMVQTESEQVFHYLLSSHIYIGVCVLL